MSLEIGLGRGLSALAVLGVALVLTACGEDSSLRKAAELKAVEVIGNIATGSMPDDSAGGFHKIPVVVVEISSDVYQVMGIGNAHIIDTEAGSVMFDTGLGIQAAKQIAAFENTDAAPVSHIILSHSHSDHIGGTRFWREKDTQIIAHREFVEEQRYLTELEPYLHQRNRAVFPWLPEELADIEMLNYGGITPDILVDERDYTFEHGGVQFDVLSTPGAEGADNISLWLPGKKILFTGDSLGPNFPQFPNVFTMRGEKVRKPIEYIHSLNKMIGLAPEILVPSHREHIVGREGIVAGLTLIRDAVQYVHDEVVAGMNAGKTVHQLMDQIELPAELALTQEHGRVSWAVKSIWEYYATWFHFDTPTELYPVPPRAIYGELAELLGVDALLSEADRHIAQRQAVHALHFIEIVQALEPGNVAAMRAQIKAYQLLLDNAVNVTKNNYEKDYMRTLIAQVEEKLDSQ